MIAGFTGSNRRENETATDPKLRLAPPTPRGGDADLYLAAQLGWAMSEGIVPERPGFAEFVATAFERPAAIRAKAFNDQYMTGK